MDILDNIAGSLGSAVASFRSALKGTVGDIPDWLSASAEGERWKNEPNLLITRNQQELYARLSWFAIATSHVAKQVAGTPLSVKQLVGEKRVGIDNHEFELLLGKPNESQSRFEFLEALQSYKTITGNGYVWLNKVNEAASPEEMWVIPSDRMRPIPDERMYIRGYMYDTGHGEELPLEAWEVMHLRRFNPQNQYVGLSAVEALAIVAEGDLAAQKYNTNYFSKNNAKASGIVAFADAINNTDWATIKDDWKKQHGGTKRNLLMLRNTGQKGVNWISTAMTQKDMEFLAGRSFTKEEIYATIAPGLASWLDINSTEANSVTGKEAFRELAVWPETQALSQKITNDILPTYGDGLVAEFDDVRIEDVEKQLKQQDAFERTHTVNEIREKFYDDDPIVDERGNLFPSEVNKSLPFGQSESVTEDSESIPEEAKAHEIGQFRTFAKRRIDEGRIGKIADFKFKHLDLQEQTAVKAEFALNDLKALTDLTNAIDAVREENEREELAVFGAAIDDIGKKVDARQDIIVNVEAPDITVKVPDQKPPEITNEIEVNVPKAEMQAAPIIKNEITVPETKVVIQKEDWKEEITKVIERDENDKLKTLRKTRK